MRTARAPAGIERRQERSPGRRAGPRAGSGASCLHEVEKPSPLPAKPVYGCDDGSYECHGLPITWLYLPVSATSALFLRWVQSIGHGQHGGYDYVGSRSG